LLLSDKDIIMAAIKQNVNALYYSDEALKMDKDIKLLVINYWDLQSLAAWDITDEQIRILDYILIIFIIFIIFRYIIHMFGII